MVCFCGLLDCRAGCYKSKLLNPQSLWCTNLAGMLDNLHGFGYDTSHVVKWVWFVVCLFTIFSFSAFLLLFWVDMITTPFFVRRVMMLSRTIYVGFFIVFVHELEKNITTLAVWWHLTNFLFYLQIRLSRKGWCLYNTRLMHLLHYGPRRRTCGLTLGFRTER